MAKLVIIDRLTNKIQRAKRKHFFSRLHLYIARNHSGINETITVRRIVANEGVERIFPLHSPRLAKIEVVRRGDARRAKLYYLRDRIGKSRRLRDQRRGLQHVEAWEAGHADRVAASKAGQDSAEAAPPTGDE